jgi:hypothetical protein
VGILALQVETEHDDKDTNEYAQAPQAVYSLYRTKDREQYTMKCAIGAEEVIEP